MIDACAHPVVARADDINAYLAREHRLQKFWPPDASIYPVPIDDHVPGSVPRRFVATPRAIDEAPAVVGSIGAHTMQPLPGSDPELLAKHVLADTGAEYAILLPLTRGLVSDPDFDAAICSATNTWQAETWLGDWNGDGRFKGSIRVCPRVPERAVQEIERWADHQHFVQVAVPLESHMTYGEQQYFPVWKAAAEHGLPVAIHSDDAGGVLSAPTPVGYPMYALEARAQLPMYGVTHLASLIGHGVFDRLESLVFVFADGGFDYMATLMWRLDKDWRSSRAEVPWMRTAPSGYLQDNVRYVVHGSDGIDDPVEHVRFIELNGLEGTLLYGSNYPSWDHLPAAELGDLLPAATSRQVMDTNARRLYGLPQRQLAEA